MSQAKSEGASRYHSSADVDINRFLDDDFLLGDVEHTQSLDGGSPRIGNFDSLDFMDMDAEMELMVVPARDIPSKQTIKPALSPRLVSADKAKYSTAPVKTPVALPTADFKAETSIGMSAVTDADSSARKKVTIATPDAMDAVDVCVPSLLDCQSLNKQILQSQLVFLHQNGILVVGNVLHVTLFDASVPATLSFKVLFVEGGSQPAVFRCKTPIFSSDPVQVTSTQSGTSDIQAQWDDNSFRFDMIMAANKDKSRPFSISGDVLLSIYRARANGGQDLLGQASFDLKKVAESGTVEVFGEQVQGRSLSGSYSIVQGSRIVGEVELQFNMAWNSRPCDLVRSSSSADVVATPSERPSTAHSVGSRQTQGTGVTRGVSASGRASSAQRSKSPAATTRPTAQTATGTATGGKFVVEPQRKIVSRLARQQREDAQRIERENKTLRSRIQKLVVSSGDAYGDKEEAKQAVNKLQTAPGMQQQYVAEAKDVDRLVDAKRKQQLQSKDEPPVSNPVPAGQNSVQSLQETLGKLRKEIADQDSEIQSLRGKLNNLNIHIDKSTAQIQRLQQVSTSTGSVTGSTRGNTSARNVISAAAQSKTDTQSGATVQPMLFDYPAYEGADAEYTSIKEEYDILQRMRRALVERVQRAKASIGHVEEHESQLDKKLRTTRDRLLALGDEFSPFLVATSAPAQLPANSEDISLYLKNIQLRDELIVAQLQQVENPQRLQLCSARVELQSIVDVLQRQRDQLQKDLLLERERKAKLFADIQQSECDAIVFTLRERITAMRAMEVRTQSLDRQQIVLEGMQACNVEELRLKLLRTEREKLAGRSELRA